MKSLVGIVVGTMVMTACAEQPPEVAVFSDGAGLDCSRGFDGLHRDISTKPGIVASLSERAASAYREDVLSTLYLFTRPDHPAHPAIFVRSVMPGIEGNTVISAACGYGDPAAFEREVAAYRAFDRLLNAEEACFHCGSDRLASPTIIRRMPPPPAAHTDQAQP